MSMMSTGVLDPLFQVHLVSGEEAKAPHNCVFARLEVRG